jgi:hypothetical protein
VIFTLKSHEIAAHWHLIEPFFFEHYEWTPEKVKAQLESAKAQLWGLADANGIRGVVITKTNLPLGLIWIASGKGLDGEAMQLLADIEAWMKERGCTDVVIEGRRGWGRVLEGYEEKATVFVKRLN